MATDRLYEEVVKKLLHIHVKFPDLRIGRVLQAALDHAKRGNNVNLNDVSTKEILRCLYEFDDITTKKRGVKL